MSLFGILVIVPIHTEILFTSIKYVFPLTTTTFGRSGHLQTANQTGMKFSQQVEVRSRRQDNIIATFVIKFKLSVLRLFYLY